MERIIVGYDGSEQAARALDRAAELAQALASPLLVVSVSRFSRPSETAPAVELAETPFPAVPGGPAALVTPIRQPKEPSPEPQELAERQLEQARMVLAQKQVGAEYVAEVGDAAERLLAIAQERDADLIVVGSREHGFLDRLLGRHVDEAVAAHAGCDVLLVH